jgi:hypothetical protein
VIFDRVCIGMMFRALGSVASVGIYSSRRIAELIGVAAAAASL